MYCIRGKVVLDMCVCVLCKVYIGHNRWFLKKSDILFFTFHIFDLIGTGGNRRRARGGILIF